MASTIILSDNGASSGSAGLKQTAGNDGVLILQTTTSGGTATNAVYVDTSQRVGIGTSSPARILNLSSSGSNCAIRIDNTVSGRPALIAYDDSQVLTVTNSSDTGYINFVIGTGSGTERLRLNTSGTVILQGGSTSATGVGITFPATQSASSDANTLDDYEEGTWTPEITGLSSAPTVGYSARTGSYTKVGNMVTLFGFISLSSISGGSGTAAISGLPFATSANYRNGGALGYISFVNNTAGYTQTGLYSTASQTHLRFTESGDNLTAIEVSVSQLGSSLNFTFTYTYSV